MGPPDGPSAESNGSMTSRYSPCPKLASSSLSANVSGRAVNSNFHEARVWHVWLDRSESEAARRRDDLSPDELARCERIRQPLLARRFVVGRSIVRQILAECIGCCPQRVPIEYDAAGKPVLPKDCGWYFNVSHSGERAIVGVTRSGPIGVDIERIREGFAVEPIARRFFSPREVADLLSLPPDARPTAFFRCWTRKEAFVKAVGLGLSYPLDEFDVTLLPHDPPAIRSIKGNPAEGARWGLYDVAVPPGYIGALASPIADLSVVVEAELLT